MGGGRGKESRGAPLLGINPCIWITNTQSLTDKPIAEWHLKHHWHLMILDTAATYRVGFSWSDMNRDVQMINGQYQDVQWIITRTNIITPQSQHDIKTRADFVEYY